MQKLKQKADELGRLISESGLFKTFKEKHEGLSKDKDALELLKEYQKVFDRVYQLEREGKPVEVEDKHSLRDAQEALHSNVLLH